MSARSQFLLHEPKCREVMIVIDPAQNGYVGRERGDLIQNGQNIFGLPAHEIAHQKTRALTSEPGIEGQYSVNIRLKRREACKPD